MIDCRFCHDLGEEAEQAQQQQKPTGQAQWNYNKAVAACLEGRGYAVKYPSIGRPLWSGSP